MDWHKRLYPQFTMGLTLAVLTIVPLACTDQDAPPSTQNQEKSPSNESNSGVADTQTDATPTDQSQARPDNRIASPWPGQYKIAPWDLKALTPADVVGPDGIVYPDFRRAGVEGGIPDVSDWKQFDVSTYDGSDNQKAAAALADAVAAGGGVVVFPAGRYTLDKELKVTSDRIVFRGAGKDKTVLELGKGGSGDYLFHFEGDKPVWPKYKTVGTVKRGSGRITLSRVDGCDVGDWVRLCSTTTEPGDTMADRYNRPHVGLVQKNPARFGRSYFGRITAIDFDAKTIELDRPVLHDFYADEDPELRKCAPIQQVGIEALTIATPSAKVDLGPVKFRDVTNGWMKGVTLNGCKDWPYKLDGSNHIELRDCEFDGTVADIGKGGDAYLSVSGWYGGAYNLMDNCVARDLRHMAIYQWGNGSVIRNSTFEGKTVQSPQLHGYLPHENLLETSTFTCSGGATDRAYSVDNNASMLHGVQGPRMVVYNNTHTGGRGYGYLSYVEAHILAYNTFSNSTQFVNPGIWATNKAFDAIIRGNSFELDRSMPLVDLCDLTSVGWEVYDNQVYGSNGYAWEGDGQVVVNDNNRIVSGDQRDARVPEASSIYQWQREYADKARLLLVIDRGAIVETTGSTAARLIRLIPGGDATAGRLAVSLSGGSGAAALPASVTIPNGSNFVDFTIKANDVGKDTSVTVTAGADGYLSDIDTVDVLDANTSVVFAQDKPDRFANGPKPGWANGDFGKTHVKGSTRYDASEKAFIVTGGGPALNKNQELCETGRQFCYAAIDGDGELIARLTDLGKAGNRSVGLMIIDDESSLGDAYVLTASTGVYAWNWKNWWNLTELDAPEKNRTPVWLRIKREGAVLSSYYATSTSRPAAEDDWKLVNSQDFHEELNIYGYGKAYCEFDDIMYFGMWVNSNSQTSTVTARFESVELVGQPVAATGNR